MFLDLWPICLGSPISTIWLFGFLSNVPNSPFPRHFPRDPLCQGQAGMDRPRGHASPVARAPKLWASRLLVGSPAGGLSWGQKWGEVNLPAARVPAATLGTEMNGGWVGTRPVGLGAQATPADESTSQLSCSAGLPSDLPYYPTSPRLAPRRPRGARTSWGPDRVLRRRARCHRGVGGELPKCAEGGHLLQPDGAPLLTHLQSLPPRQPLASRGPLPDGLRAPS